MDKRSNHFIFTSLTKWEFFVHNCISFPISFYYYIFIWLETVETIRTNWRGFIRMEVKRNVKLWIRRSLSFILNALHKQMTAYRTIFKHAYDSHIHTCLHAYTHTKEKHCARSLLNYHSHTSFQRDKKKKKTTQEKVLCSKKKQSK